MEGSPIEAEPAGHLSFHELGAGIGMTLVRVTEVAALACGRMLGKGDQERAKAAASAAMHQALDAIGLNGRVVLGPAGDTLSHGFRVGSQLPDLDLALYPVEGASLVARGMPNAVSMVVATSAGGFTTLPAVAYMEKMVAGPLARGAIDLADTVVDNLLRIAFSRD